MASQILHRSDRRQHVRDIPVGAWVWDALNAEPAYWHGWSTSSRCYIGEWLEGGGLWCAWDQDATGQPHTLEVLTVEQTD